MNSLQTFLNSPYFKAALNRGYTIIENLERSEGFKITYADFYGAHMTEESVTKYEIELQSKYKVSDIIWTKTTERDGISFSVTYTKRSKQFCLTFYPIHDEKGAFECSMLYFKESDWHNQSTRETETTSMLEDFKVQISQYLETAPEFRLKSLFDQIKFYC